MADWMGELVSGRYAPHGYCLLWQPELVWTHVVSDSLIALSYFSIPLALAHFARQRRDIAFGWVLWLFALFILACGTSHLMAIWNLWHGNYALEGLVKAITAAASVPTAILLWRLIPLALRVPSPAQLQVANRTLARLVEQRDAALASLHAEIAQRERAEDALIQAQKIDAVGQLTGGIAHDFNNLLQAVAGNIGLIQAQPSQAEKVARWAQNAMRGVERGTRLTGQLLAFSRTQRLRLEAAAINPLIEGMLDLVRQSLGAQVRLETSLADDVCSVRCDRTQLELAILNLSINARDAMPEGGRLLIQTRQRSIVADELELEAGEYAEIAVIDTGTGMSPEVMRRALEPFFTTKGVGQGTGLGLSMAFGIARQSGGTLTIDSSPGAGTTVAILLRCVAEEEAGADGASDDEAPGNVPVADRAGIRIMLVDDDDDVRDVVCSMLQGLGYDCHAFADGPSAIAALPQLQPDLAVLDFAMPDMNGAEVAQRIRGLRPATRIIFASGYADSAALDDVIDQRSAYLPKPFDTAALARLVATLTRSGA